MDVSYRWLGVAGLEFTAGDFTLLIDPFFTRPGKLALLTNSRVAPNAALIRRHVTSAGAVLVTHPHYDHLLDVPFILRGSGAPGFGSPNTCALLEACGVPAEQVHCIRPGDRFHLGPFTVEVFPARHTPIPLGYMNGPLSARLGRPSAFETARAFSRLWAHRIDGSRAYPSGAPLGPLACPPLRLSDYRMDANYSFRLEVAGRTLLVGNYPVAVQTMFFSPYHPRDYMTTLLQTAGPQTLVPIHWEDFTLPLSRPPRPMLVTRAQGLDGFPPIRRADLAAFARNVKTILPGMEVLLPEIFKPYRID